MFNRILWVLSALLLLPSTLLAQSSATVNTTNERACFWYGAFAAGTDQFIAGDQSVSCVNPGETAYGWLAFDESQVCEWQGDWFKFPLTTTAPPSGPTLGALGNYFWGAKGGNYYRGGNCAATPPPPPPPPPPPQCVNKSFTFGGGGQIARFPEGFVNPWLPLWLGPFYLDLPKFKYHVYAWSYDDHSHKKDGYQNEIGEFWLDYGLIVGPTQDIPDDQDYQFSDLGVWDVTQDVKFFYVVHATRGAVSEPTGSFAPQVVYFNCAEGGQ